MSRQAVSLLPCVLLICACSAPGPAAPQRAELAPEALRLLRHIASCVARADRTLGSDDTVFEDQVNTLTLQRAKSKQDRSPLDSLTEALALLVVWHQATDSDPRALPGWGAVQDQARHSLAHLHDPVALLGDARGSFELNERNLATLRAGHMALVAADPELSLARGVLLDFAGEEQQARGWMEAMLASLRGRTAAHPAAYQWLAWRAVRDGEHATALLTQAEALRLQFDSRLQSATQLDATAAGLALLLLEAGLEAEAKDVARALPGGKAGSAMASRDAPRQAGWSPVHELALAALALRGLDGRTAEFRLVSWQLHDLAVVGVEVPAAGGPAFRPVAWSGRMGGADEPWQAWLSGHAPVELLRTKALEHVRAGRLSDLEAGLEIAGALVGSLRPLVARVVANLARYPDNDVDDVLWLDQLLRERLGDGPQPAPVNVLYPKQFVTSWGSWDGLEEG